MTFYNGFQAFLYFFLIVIRPILNFEWKKKFKSIYLTAQKIQTYERILHVRLEKAKTQLFISFKNVKNVPEIVFRTFFFVNLVRFMVEFYLGQILS